MRTLLLLAFIVSGFFFPAAQVLACSYGGDQGSMERYIELADLVVSASVEFVDELGKNGVLQVDRYFKGSGGEFLPLVYFRPAVFYADTVRDYDNGCLTIGPWGVELSEGESGYFALYANGDGTYDYSSVTMWIPGDIDRYGYQWPTDGMVDFYIDSRSEWYAEAPLPIPDFEALLLEMSKQEETVVPDDGKYPLMRFLNITTESGKRYRLNPDFSVTWLDPDKWPIAISNDGSHLMFRLEMDELGFQYLSLVRKELHPCPYCQPLGSAIVGGGRALSTGAYSNDGWLEPVKGWHATFSPDSNFVAVQERNDLLIYMFDNWSLAEYEYGRLMGMEVVAGQRVWWHLSFVWAEPLAWSADSTTIAYQDSRGIWHWDFFEETHPQLVLPGDGSNELLDISNSGRYIRYSHDESWSLIDVESGKTYERAIATPDERNLIFVQPSYPKGTVTLFSGRENHYRKAWRTCHAPLSDCPIHVVYPYNPIDIFEYQPGWIGLVSRRDIQLFPWYLSMEEGRLHVGAEPPQAINAFDYDKMYNRPAIAYGDYKLGLSFSWDYSKMLSEEARYEFLDLQNYLDSPIVDLEWGQPVFLDRR